MGLDIHNAKFLSLCKKLGVDYSQTLTFGHQQMVIGEKWKICPGNANGFAEAIQNDKYADSYLAFLGASRIDISDASAYEGANIILDLNQPPPDHLGSSYTCVIDLGTLEHVFHYSRALQTAMTCVAESGHIIIATPANNLMGHGFYQLSPELFLQAFTEENGFEVVKMILADQFEESPWYEIRLTHRPTELATRFVSPSNWASTYLMVLARRKSIKPIFANAPQQMSYESMWNNKNLTHDQLSSPAKQLGSVTAKSIVDFLRKSSLISVYRQLRAVLGVKRLPDYYQVIPSNEWMNY